MTSMLIGLVELAFVAAGLMAFVDALRHSPQAFDAVGRGPRGAWLGGLVLSILVLLAFRSIMFEIMAIVAISVYMVEIRHQLAAVEPRR